MIPEAPEVEVIIETPAELGEGPVWDPRARVLYWVDILPGNVHRYDPRTNTDVVFPIGQAVGAVAPRAAGGLVLAVRDGFGLLDLDTGHWEMIASVEAETPGNRMNDGAVDSRGRFWAGTMAFAEDPEVGSLYRLDANHQVELVLQRVSVSNGIGWSPDDWTMYYADTPTHTVDAFDFDPPTGQISNRRPFITISPEHGGPDGLTVDSEGYLWVALWGGWSVRRYSPTGELDRTIDLPVDHVTSCAFGGNDLSELYITTAWHNLSAAERQDQPHAGCLFRCRPGVTGVPAPPYAG